MESIIEQRVLAACRSGDAGAYGQLVDAYWARSVGFARAMVGNTEDAQDLAQEAFVAAYKALPQHIPGRPFYPWLRGILLNRARMFLRSRGRARARRDAAATMPDHWAAPRPATAADSATTDWVSHALEVLDDEARSLLVLKHVEGFTYDELAAALGIPAGTVMSRLYRARRQMREELERLAPHILNDTNPDHERDQP
jgi:RNA polymerase sigma-70 factor (ECF subfamily)